jgi:16S rRNA (adenine1518-N6/adenine1519-N6)-dimethyltransferase
VARVSRLADTAFTQRRKTLRNTLSGLADAATLARAATAAGIDLGARAETLDVDAYRRLDEELGGRQA